MDLLESVGGERRFQLLVDAVTDYAIYLLDAEGRVASWNSGAERIKGYTAAEALGGHFSRFYTPEDREDGLPGRALETARTTGRYEAEGWRVRKDGSRFWAQVVINAIRAPDGRVIGFAKVTRDITERRAAQDALADSERQFRLLVAGVVDYALYMLDPTGVIVSWNAGAQQIKGYAAQEIIGQHFSRFFTEADRDAGVPERGLEQARLTGRYEAEGWRRRKDGSLFWASVVLDAIHDENGVHVGFAKITRDITERRQAQADLQLAQERLAQAQKMEALGQLTGGVAHDFNNLLMIVSGQAQMLRARLSDDPRLLRALDAIAKAVERGASLTRQLLTFSRRQRLNPRPTDVAAQIGAFREMLESSLHGNIQLRVGLPDELWPVSVDLGELELALVNIAVNARDAMPEGGALTVSARNATLAPGDEGVELEGEFVALVFRDTGIGIPPDILPKVFDPFFTTKPVSKGTGLGLSQVYGFAHQSGGAVTVASDLGQGAAITVFLPRSTALPTSEGQAASDPAEPGGGRILVVEDNSEVAAVSAAILEQLGYEVRVVPDARSAVDIMAAGETVDLVFSDIVMAGAMDGFALARRLREDRPTLPILLTSGYSRAAEAAQSEFPILRKPYQIAELGGAVARLIAGARADDGDGEPIRFPARRANGPAKGG